MRYFLGVDGGGTKTAYKLVNQQGHTLALQQARGSSHKQYGTKGVVDALLENIDACLAKAKLTRADLTGMCFGLPLYGETPPQDADMQARLQQALPAAALVFVNDVEVGWAGSLGCEPGINIVAGTGSIAFGKNEAGQAARCGGWSEHFSDEGSCYWAALQAIQLFTKQADGRAEKGALYHLVRKKYALQHDFDFVALVENELLPSRDTTAAFQTTLLEAAQMGDSAAAAIYTRAAYELFSLAKALYTQLAFRHSPVHVSYSGGIFHAGKLILQPLHEQLHAHDMQLLSPRLPPVDGAVLLGAKTGGQEIFNAICAQLLQDVR